jgi:hypothetical protein
MNDIKTLLAVANMVFFFDIPAGNTTLQAIDDIADTAHLTITLNPSLIPEVPKRPAISGTMSVAEALCVIFRQTDAAFMPVDGDPTTISVVPRQMARDPKFVMRRIEEG